MKTKIKILIVSFVMAAAAVTGFNMAQNSNNMDVSLADIAVMARAGGSEEPVVPACVDVIYHPNSIQADSYSTCYDSDGNACGLQQTCVADPNGHGCNAAYCQGHTSG